jgi:capsular exopolysaccharide synthesis family protein
MSVIQTREIAPQIVRLGPGRVFGRPSPAEGRQPDSGLSGRDILRILRKRKWLIILAELICVALAVGATVLWLMYAPLFTSFAVLEVRPEATSAVTPQPGYMAREVLETLAVKYASLAGSEPVLQTALATPEVRNTIWLQKSPDDALLRLQDTISILPITSSALIRISATGTNKTELPDIVNAVANAARERSSEIANRGKQDQIRQFLKERTSLADTRDRIRADKAKLMRDADVPDLTSQTNVRTMELNMIAQQVSVLELEFAQADQQLQLLRQQIRSGDIAKLPAVLQAMDMDPSIRALESALLNMKARQPSMERKYGPRSQKYIEYVDSIGSMQKEVDARRQVLLQAQVNAIVANTEASKAIILGRLTEMRQKYRQIDVSVRDLRATLSAYAQLEEQDKTLTGQVDRIDSRLVDLRILLQGNAPLEMMQLAYTPLEPSMPRWQVMVPLGVLLGLIVGLGLAFLLEFIDTSIKGPSDIVRRIDLPLLGMVPHHDDVEENIADLRVAFASHPNSLIGEAFRQIRTCLQFSGPASQRRSLLITSPQPADGRTTVALNLAASIARAGRKVLVVDANLRLPAVRGLFPACPEGGLSSALVGQAAWRDMTLEIEPNFSVMASGPLPPNPGELLGSEQMRTVLAEMVGQYDQVIFDGAPCLVVTDSMALGNLVDGIVMVVRAGANTYGIVQRAQEVLSRGPTHILGIVLNGVRAVAGGYLRKNYEAFYDYHEQTKLLQK